MKVMVTEYDRFCHTIIYETEAKEDYGYTVEEDDEVFTDLPEDLVNEYQAIYKRFWELNAKIRELK